MMGRLAPLLCVALLGSACSLLSFGSSCDGAEVIGHFEEIGDLPQASNVQSSDVVVGSITEIELDKGTWEARVTMCIQPDQQIPADVEAVVRTTSLLGEKFVDLQTNAEGPPYLEDGTVLGIDRTSKATELEDVFARLGTILGTGNLEELNRFTSAQARILEDHSGQLREVLGRLRRFTDVLVSRRGPLASSLDNLDDVSRTILKDSETLRRFLRSFAESSTVLANNKNGLRALLEALDRFTKVSIALLEATETGLDKQFRELRPVLATVVANSKDLSDGLRTLGTFTEWFPETMPGDYLQLDVCQAPPERYGQGKSCPQSVKNDDFTRSAGSDARGDNDSLRFILERPLEARD